MALAAKCAAVGGLLNMFLNYCFSPVRKQGVKSLTPQGTFKDALRASTPKRRTLQWAICTNRPRAHAMEIPSRSFLSASWFQVCCPECREALQVLLPAGDTEVKCDGCEHLFNVYVVPQHISSRAHIKFRRQGPKPPPASGPPPAVYAYRLYMKNNGCDARRSRLKAT